MAGRPWSPEVRQRREEAIARYWTPEARAKRAEEIRKRAPWEKSTGARTEEGKRISSSNSVTNGSHCKIHNHDLVTARRLARSGDHEAALEKMKKFMMSQPDWELDMQPLEPKVEVAVKPKPKKRRSRKVSPGQMSLL
jgi:hypothetical protein